MSQELEQNRRSERSSKLTIRAHHLPIFSDYLSSGDTATHYAKDDRNNLEKSREDKTERRYITDVLGKTPADADRYERRFAAILKVFDSLEADDTVTIVYGPDAICHASCGKGRHCRLSDTREYGGHISTVDVEEWWLNSFINGATKIDRAKTMSIHEDLFTPTDGLVEETYRFEMPAGALKETLIYLATGTESSDSQQVKETKDPS